MPNKPTKAQIDEVRELLKMEKPDIIKAARPELAPAVDAVLAETKEKKPASSGCCIQRSKGFRV